MLIWVSHTPRVTGCLSIRSKFDHIRSSSFHAALQRALCNFVKVKLSHLFFLQKGSNISRSFFSFKRLKSNLFYTGNLLPPICQPTLANEAVWRLAAGEAHCGMDLNEKLCGFKTWLFHSWFLIELSLSTIILIFDLLWIREFYSHHTLPQEKNKFQKKCTNFLNAPACSTIPPWSNGVLIFAPRDS